MQEKAGVRGNRGLLRCSAGEKMNGLALNQHGALFQVMPLKICQAKETSSPHVYAFLVNREAHGIRIDSFLVRCLRNYTPFRMQRMVRAGAVCVDGEVVPLIRRVFHGEGVTVRLVEPPDKLLDPEPLPLNILHEDEAILVVNKPAGQIAHPVGKRQTGTLCNAVQWHLDRQTPLRGLLRPGIVHRLDRLTSGVIVIAKTFSAHRQLSIQFQRQHVRKAYLAVVEGCVKPESGMVNSPIGHCPGGESILMTTRPDARNPKSACTHFRVLHREIDRTLVRAEPRTGRIHQIRVHLASIGHPVIGDEFYGPHGEIRAARFKKSKGNASPINHEPRHLLHASELTFTHPTTGIHTTIFAPLPADFLSNFCDGVSG